MPLLLLQADEDYNVVGSLYERMDLCDDITVLAAKACNLKATNSQSYALLS